MSIERTFAMIKPDGVRRNLISEIISRIEAKGFRIVGLKLMQISREAAETHYGEHKSKPFFEGAYRCARNITRRPSTNGSLGRFRRWAARDYFQGWRPP